MTDGTMQVVPPIKFSLKVPESVRVHSAEAPLVGLWDAPSRTWSTEHVSEVSYSAEDRTVRFQVRAALSFILWARRTNE